MEKSMKRLVIAGGGFAGFWSAMSAARHAMALGVRDRLTITLINRDEYLGLRPRFYEACLAGTRVPLRHWLVPLGIGLVIGEIASITPASRCIQFANGANVVPDIIYDQLILATGSRQTYPDFVERDRVFSVDTFAEATTLDQHLRTLAARGFPTPASRTFVVIGGSFTGLEIVTALPSRLEHLAPSAPPCTFHLMERAAEIGLGYAPDARQHITRRLQHLGVTVHTGQEGLRHEKDQLILADHQRLPTETVIIATGFAASPLAAAFGGPGDRLGRLVVDTFLRLPGHPEVLAAGDVSLAKTDPDHHAVMSCQHAMPQGRTAGYNAVSLLLNKDPLPYAQPHYRTCLDLGPGDALVTAGWDRHIITIGPEAKAIKTEEILNQTISPPTDTADTLAMASPVTTS
jgi:NADH dehydrogenase